MADVPAGYSQITGLSTAKGLGTIPTGVYKAVIVSETQSVRYRDDGTDPTASVGMLLPAGTFLTVEGRAINTVKFIETTTSAKLNVSFYKRKV